MRIHPMRALFVGAMSYLTAACSAMSPTPLSAGLQPGEAVAPAVSSTGWGLAHLRPDFQYFNGMWDAYRAGPGQGAELDKEIVECRQNPDGCHPLFLAWVKTIDAINLFPPEPEYEKAKLAFAAGAIANLMNTDHNKDTALNALFHSGNWLQSPEKTLIEKNGLGTCGDYTMLAYETLLRSGFGPEKLTVVGGIEPQAYFHIVLKVEATSEFFVLDATGRKKLAQEDTDAEAIPRPTVAKYNNYLSGYRIEEKPWLNREQPFFPLFDMNARGIKTVGGFLDVLGAPLRFGGDYPLVAEVNLEDNSRHITDKYPRLNIEIERKLMEIVRLRDKAKDAIAGATPDVPSVKPPVPVMAALAR